VSSKRTYRSEGQEEKERRKRRIERRRRRERIRTKKEERSWHQIRESTVKEGE
jgi:hypothetical protein